MHSFGLGLVTVRPVTTVGPVLLLKYIIHPASSNPQEHELFVFRMVPRSSVKVA
jgi:hypothetical protein